MSSGLADSVSVVRTAPSRAYDYLVLSDVHLGSDLVQHVRPWARNSWLSTDAEVDNRLISLLAHYRERAGDERKLCLIIAGDFLDLVGVSLPLSDATLKTRPTREERRHGLGSAHDHVVQKVQAIAARHTRVFAALCEFLAIGHRLVIVRGNHDIELHWRAAQRALVDAIRGHASDERTARDVAARIRICPWFFAVEGLLYVEHGHEFDTMCSYGDPLLPTCPRDSRRIRLSPFAVMLRHVARPTRGLSSRNYENVGFGAYLRLMLHLGISGTAGIALRFTRAVSALLGECFAQLRSEHAMRVLRGSVKRRRFANQTATSLGTLRQLTRLYARPAACSFRMVMRTLYLDRVLALTVALSCVALGAYLARYRALLDGVLYALPAALLAAYACFAPNRDLAPTARMRAGANQIARLFRARYVVMGHTHEAEEVPLESGATYLNVGHWGEDDVPEERSDQSAPVPCSYLWLSQSNGYRAELLRWDAAFGPRSFSPAPRPEVERPRPHTALPQSA
jgi:UDP-2,3-diacylglucosamine pyrophosphatase LpxH